MKIIGACSAPFRRRSLRTPAVVLALILSAALLLSTAPLPLLAQSTVQDPAAQDDGDGTVYTVQRGDSWSTVAEATGVSVAALKEANPDAVRATDWLIVGEELFIPAAAADETTEPDIYTVESGESWNSIAEVVGLTAAALKAANPLSVRTGDVLYVGERLVIPPAAGAAEATATPTATPEPDAGGNTGPAPSVPPRQLTRQPTATPAALPTRDASATPASSADATPAPTEEAVEEPATEEPAADATDAAAEQTYIVQAGESWNSIAAKLGIAAQALRNANPDLIRPGLVLYREDKLIIPGAATATPAATEAAATGSETPDADADTPEDTAAEGAAAEGTAPETAEVELPACPEEFAGYPDTIDTLLNTPGASVDTLNAFLTACSATLADGVTAVDLTGDELDDLVVVYVNPTSDTAALETELLIFNAVAADGADADSAEIGGYELAHRAGAAGEVRVLATEDINADEQADVVWVDTNCGASTCFDTVKIYSWTGERWTNWAEDNMTMAYADVTVTDSSEEGQGREIVLDGGVYGSVGAGPQRSRTETWGSVDGAPYALLDTVYAQSNCLYHVVLDANRAFDAAPQDGFDAAEALYTEAVSDNTLVGCWVRDNEVEELQSFSYFRLALIAAYQELPDVAGDLIGSIAVLFPGNPYNEVGDVWLSAYEEDQDVAAACDAVLEYLQDAPEAWQILADYGYANPSFTAEDVCPVLDLEAEPAATGGTGAAPTPTPAAATDAADTAVEDAAATDAVDTDAATADLAPCPENVDRFATVLPDVLVAATDDTGVIDGDAIDGWLRACGALDDSRGDFRVVDLNDDGIEDAVFMPTIVSDLGYGPGGSQGAVLIYHGAADGTFALVFEPDIYGQPALLAVEDLNEDGRLDVAWSVESCSTFCVLEVQMVAWNGTEYVSGIEPGATIAEGEVEFVDLGTSAPGQGKAILLSGGVSGVPEGGLEVPHTENWQSVDGAPYARLEWVYDRDVDGNDCVGLRLVEADVAMQAADVLGWDDAIGMYTNALDSELKACSLFGIPGDEELILLQGLASFRLIQAQALSGDDAGAQATLLALQSGQPESDYTEAAATWLASYNATGDADAACGTVDAIFTGNDELWRITDQFGYNHPALAAEQICFRP